MTTQAMMEPPGEPTRPRYTPPTGPKSAEESPARVAVLTDTCDANCPQDAKFRWMKDKLILTLCGHHSHAHEPALAGSGWNSVVVAPLVS